MVEYALKLLLAVVCGGAIGLEREATGKPAGLRTNILISVGSTLITIVSASVAHEVGDPGRIAAQIVTGVGFIGAGSIIQARGSITGLTTAATIWAVAGIGISIGAGLPMLAVWGTVVILACLTLLRRFDPDAIGGKKHFSIEITAQRSSSVSEILQVLATGNFSVEETELVKHDDRLVVSLSCNANRSRINEILALLGARDDVISARTHE